jgi:hypothetical protein
MVWGEKRISQVSVARNKSGMVGGKLGLLFVSVIIALMQTWIPQSSVFVCRGERVIRGVCQCMCEKYGEERRMPANQSNCS